MVLQYLYGVSSLLYRDIMIVTLTPDLRPGHEKHLVLRHIFVDGRKLLGLVELVQSTEPFSLKQP